MTMKLTLLFSIATTLILSSPALSQIYQWTDSKGTVHFSETPPKNSSIKIKTVKQVYVSPEKKDWIVARKIETRESEAEQQRLAREKLRQQQQRPQQAAPSRELFTKENSDMGWQSRLALNKQILRNSKRTKLIGKAEATKLGLGWQARKQMNEQIIANQGFVSGQRSNNNTASDYSSHDPVMTTQINGEWDNNGRHYSPAGGGNLWKDDGTFMQKAAGGYIDTKTGLFIPAN